MEQGQTEQGQVEQSSDRLVGGEGAPDLANREILCSSQRSAKPLTPTVDQRGMDLDFTGELTDRLADICFLGNLKLELTDKPTAFK